MNPVRLIVLLLVIFVSSTAMAQVQRSESGLGGALIVPYWTGAGGNDSLLSIRNDSDRATVAKLHWLDDQGQLLQSFNLYLDAHSVWTEAIATFAIGPALSIRGSGCVLPTTLTTNIESWFSVMPLASARGSLEIIEMASAADASVLASDGRWIDCSELAERFEAGNPWHEDPNAGLTTPTQELSASIAIINVPLGGMNTIAATALTGFSDLAQHSAPESSFPDLSHAFDSGASEGGVRSLVCPASGCRIDEWPEPVSAIAAVLMATSLRTDYTILPDFGGQYEWMIHRPLKRHEAAHEDFEIGSTPTLAVRLRDGSIRQFGEVCIPTPPMPMFPPCGSIEAPLESGVVQHSLAFNASVQDVGDLIQSLILAHPTKVWPAFALGDPQSGFTEGTAELLLGNHDQPLIAVDGTAFLGEPVIAFGIQQFTNGTLVDGDGQNVLANYRSTEQSRRHLIVTESD